MDNHITRREMLKTMGASALALTAGTRYNYNENE